MSKKLHRMYQELQKKFETYTWEDLDDLFRQYEREGESTEYLNTRPDYDSLPEKDRLHLDQPVWRKGVRWIEVSWVVGGSEGYYVHFRPAGLDSSKLYALGKFWDNIDANRCADFFTRFFNGLRMTQAEIDAFPEYDKDEVPSE